MKKPGTQHHAWSPCAGLQDTRDVQWTSRIIFCPLKTSQGCHWNAHSVQGRSWGYGTRRWLSLSSPLSWTPNLPMTSWLLMHLPNLTPPALLQTAAHKVLRPRVTQWTAFIPRHLEELPGHKENMSFSNKETFQPGLVAHAYNRRLRQEADEFKDGLEVWMI